MLESQQVGPKVGGELREKGMLAILATLALILVYVAFRFELAFAPGAVFALFHDVSIVVGILHPHGSRVQSVDDCALLTIIKYSPTIQSHLRPYSGKYEQIPTARHGAPDQRFDQ